MIRGLAIMAVVLIHTCPAGMWQVVCRPFINFCVGAFLFLSGYLTEVENDNWWSFYRKRILRVIIPYVIWNVLYSILNGEGLKAIIANLITTQAAGHLYYVFVYIQCVVLTPVLGKLARSNYRWLGWIIAPLSTIVFRYYYVLSGNTCNSYLSLFWSVCCLGWLTYYYLGLMIGNKLVRCDYEYRKLILFYVASILLQMGEGYVWLRLGEANCGTQLKLTSFLTGTLFLLLCCRFLESKSTLNKHWLVVLGDSSFGIYLVHMMVIKVLSGVPVYEHIPYILNSILVLAISMAFVSIGSRICGRKVGRWIGFC